MKVIDIRSDTGTLPTDEMREAMKTAVVGDDVCKDDETTNKLEQMAARLLKKESALFVPSGTFGNQLCLFTHCNRGDEVILDDQCHIIQHEAGASSIIAGVQLRAIDTKDGLMDIDNVESKIRKEINIHYPKTTLICLENALSNGKVLSIEYMKSIYQLAKKYNLKVHLDGARLFNAATSLNVNVSEIAKYADSITFCLSKGLCAPIGSLVVGTKEFISKATFKRKIMGGGMRQTGVIAAPGIIAINKMTKRLYIDHENAKILAKELAKNEKITVLQNNLDINMVFFTINKNIDDNKMVAYFKKKNILIYPSEANIYRFVTNCGVDKRDLSKIVETINEFISIS